MPRATEVYFQLPPCSRMETHVNHSDVMAMAMQWVMGAGAMGLSLYDANDDRRDDGYAH